MSSGDRGVLTLASGPERFQRWAKHLLLSIRRFDPSCRAAVVTDVVDSPWLAEFDEVIALDPSRGEPYLQKLWLPEYSPYASTLFLDADCLAYGDLGPVWDSVADGPAVGLASMRVPDPFWCPDLSRLPPRYRVLEYVQYNGGLMHWRAEPLAYEVFAEARDVFVNHYEEFGLRQFGDKPGDEPALALVMSRRGLPGITERCDTMRSLAALSGRPALRAASGRAEFSMYGHQVRPVVVHFTGPGARGLHEREMIALRLQAAGVPAWLADAAAPGVARLRSGRLRR